MNVREPAPRRHQRGHWFVRWGGRDHYLSADEAEARRLFYADDSPHPGALSRWKTWAAQRRGGGSRGAGGAGGGHAAPLTLVEASVLMLTAYRQAGRLKAAAYFRTHLARFLRVHGEADLVELTMPQPAKGRFAAPVVPLLAAFAKDLARPGLPAAHRLSNKTINHDLTSVQRLVNWCAEQGHCPAVEWTGVRKLRTARGVPQKRPVERLAAEILAATAPPAPGVPGAAARRKLPARERAALGPATDPRLRPWLCLGYLALCRPSELPRLVAREGEFRDVEDDRGRVVARGAVFVPREHKNAWRGDPTLTRHILLTDEALAWLALAEPAWSRLDSFSAACVAAGLRPGPQILRDCGASHLRERGVPLEDVDLLLGHRRPGEWPSYAAVPWHDLRRKLARISLRPAIEPPSRTASVGPAGAG